MELAIRRHPINHRSLNVGVAINEHRILSLVRELIAEVLREQISVSALSLVPSSAGGDDPCGERNGSERSQKKKRGWAQLHIVGCCICASIKIGSFRAAIGRCGCVPS